MRDTFNYVRMGNYRTAAVSEIVACTLHFLMAPLLKFVRSDYYIPTQYRYPLL